MTSEFQKLLLRPMGLILICLLIFSGCKKEDPLDALDGNYYFHSELNGLPFQAEASNTDLLEATYYPTSESLEIIAVSSGSGDSLIYMVGGFRTLESISEGSFPLMDSCRWLGFARIDGTYYHYGSSDAVRNPSFEILNVTHVGNGQVVIEGKIGSPFDFFGVSEFRLLVTQMDHTIWEGEYIQATINGVRYWESQSSYYIPSSSPISHMLFSASSFRGPVIDLSFYHLERPTTPQTFTYSGAGVPSEFNFSLRSLCGPEINLGLSPGYSDMTLEITEVIPAGEYYQIRGTFSGHVYQGIGADNLPLTDGAFLLKY